MGGAFDFLPTESHRGAQRATENKLPALPPYRLHPICHNKEFTVCKENRNFAGKAGSFEGFSLWLYVV